MMKTHKFVSGPMTRAVRDEQKGGRDDHKFDIPTMPEVKKTKKRQQNEHATMADLAAETGLSKMTISRVFTNPNKVRAATREKVAQAAEKLGYEYNALAGSFASGKSRHIGVAVDVSALMGSPYFAKLFKGAHKLIEQAGYRAVIFDITSEEFCDAKQLTRLIRQRRVEGLLAFAPPDDRMRFVSSFEQAHTSIVLIGGRVETKIVPWVDLDNRHAIRLLMQHLYELGHRRVAFIEGSQHIADAKIRHEAFHAMRKELHLEWDDAWQQPGDFSYAMGREAAYRILNSENCPTAIIAANDASAAGACEAICKLGMTPGKEISVAGIDGSEYSAQAEPPITTISQPLQEMGAVAADILLKQIDGDFSSDTAVILQGKLICRASTSQPTTQS